MKIDKDEAVRRFKAQFDSILSVRDAIEVLDDMAEETVMTVVWQKCHPDVPGVYLVRTESGEITTEHWHGGWACQLDEQTGEIYRRNERFDIEEWAEIPRRKK